MSFLRAKPKLKLTEDSIEVNLHDWGLGSGKTFIDKTQKVLSTKEKQINRNKQKCKTFVPQGIPSMMGNITMDMRKAGKSHNIQRLL